MSKPDTESRASKVYPEASAFSLEELQLMETTLFRRKRECRKGFNTAKDDSTRDYWLTELDLARVTADRVQARIDAWHAARVAEVSAGKWARD